MKKKILHKKQRVMVRLVLLGTACITLLTTLGTGMNCLVKQGGLAKNNTQLNKMNEKQVELEAKINQLNGDIAATNERIQELQDIVWRDEAVVVPDSMK